MDSFLYWLLLGTFRGKSYPVSRGQTHAGLGGFHMNVNRFHSFPRIHGDHLRQEHLVLSSGMEISTYRWNQALRDSTMWKWHVHHYTPTPGTVPGTSELLSIYLLNEWVSEWINEWMNKSLVSDKLIHHHHSTLDSALQTQVTLPLPRTLFRFPPG